jgi:hypothetical protein
LEATPVNGDTNQRLTTAATETLLDYKEEARRLIGEYAAKVVAALGHWDRREPDRLRWALGKAACNILSSERSTLTLATSRNPLVYLIAYVRFEFRHVEHFGRPGASTRTSLFGTKVGIRSGRPLNGLN